MEEIELEFKNDSITIRLGKDITIKKEVDGIVDIKIYTVFKEEETSRDGKLPAINFSYLDYYEMFPTVLGEKVPNLIDLLKYYRVNDYLTNRVLRDLMRFLLEQIENYETLVLFPRRRVDSLLTKKINKIEELYNVKFEYYW